MVQEDFVIAQAVHLLLIYRDSLFVFRFLEVLFEFYDLRFEVLSDDDDLLLVLHEAEAQHGASHKVFGNKMLRSHSIKLVLVRFPGDRFNFIANDSGVAASSEHYGFGLIDPKSYAVYILILQLLVVSLVYFIENVCVVYHQYQLRSFQVDHYYFFTGVRHESFATLEYIEVPYALDVEGAAL